MKQTKKLTRNQRDFLNSKGIEDTYNLRFCWENNKEFAYYNEETEKVEVLEK